MARYLAQNGVTGFAPASMTLPYDDAGDGVSDRCPAQKRAADGLRPPDGHPDGGAVLLRKKKGAQNGAYLKKSRISARLNGFMTCPEGLIRIADVAAELPGAVEFTKLAK